MVEKNSCAPVEFIGSLFYFLLFSVSHFKESELIVRSEI